MQGSCGKCGNFVSQERKICGSHGRGKSRETDSRRGREESSQSGEPKPKGKQELFLEGKAMSEPGRKNDYIVRTSLKVVTQKTKRKGIREEVKHGNFKEGRPLRWISGGGKGALKSQEYKKENQKGCYRREVARRKFPIIRTASQKTEQ